MIYKNTFFVESNLLGATGIIYVLKFSNGKHYVGQTINKLRTRLAGHLLDSRRDFRNRKICNAIKSTVDKIECFVLEEGKSIAELNDLESFYIAKYDSIENGYNSSSGGRNHRFSDDVRLKISQKAKGRIPSLETRLKMSASQSNKVLSTDHKIKIGMYHHRPVINIDTNQEFASLDAAAKSLEGNGKSLSTCIIRGVRFNGYRFTYKDSPNDNFKPKQKKSVKNITTGITYDSVKEAAAKNGINKITLSAYLNRKNGVCFGQQWCYA